MQAVLLSALLLLCPITLQAQPSSDDLNRIVEKALREQGKLGPNQRVVIHQHSETATATGAGGVATGDKVEHKFEGSAPTVTLPGAGASGGDSKQAGTAEMVTGSAAFRWIAGIVGVLVLGLGFLVGKQGNVRGAVVLGGSGALLFLGAIFAPEWLAVGLLLFFVISAVEYARTHSLLTGSLATALSGIHSGGATVSAAVLEEMNKVLSPGEAAIINRVAKANEAYSVKV